VIAHDLVPLSLAPPPDRAWAAWQFDEGPHGRLFIRRDRGQPPIFFSLTHTRGIVSCAIGREELIGVDVERTSRPLTRLDIGARILSPAEVRALGQCAGSERRLRLFELWTLKEACAKATGEGFLIGFRGLSFSIDGPDIGFAPPESLSTHRWSFALFAPTPDSRLAVAVGQSGPERAHVSVWDEDGEDSPWRRCARRGTIEALLTPPSVPAWKRIRVELFASCSAARATFGPGDELIAEQEIDAIRSHRRHRASVFDAAFCGQA
jgi:4'-phosphopantetheinyl transferase